MEHVDRHSREQYDVDRSECELDYSAVETVRGPEMAVRIEGDSERVIQSSLGSGRAAGRESALA